MQRGERRRGALGADQHNGAARRALAAHAPHVPRQAPRHTKRLMWTAKGTMRSEEPPLGSEVRLLRADDIVQAVFVFTRLHLDARMSWVDAPHRPNDARHAHGAGTLMHRSSRYLKSCEVGFCRAPSRPDESRSVSISRRSVCGLSLATPYRHWTTGRFASR